MLVGIFNQHVYLVARSYYSFAFYHRVYHTSFGLCSLATFESLVKSSCVGNPFCEKLACVLCLPDSKSLRCTRLQSPTLVTRAIPLIRAPMLVANSVKYAASQLAARQLVVYCCLTTVLVLLAYYFGVRWLHVSGYLCGGVGSAVHVRVGCVSRQLLFCCLVERLLWHRDDALIMYTYAATTGGTPPHYAPPPTYLAAQLPPPPPLPGGTLSPQSKRRR